MPVANVAMAAFGIAERTDAVDGAAFGLVSTGIGSVAQPFPLPSPEGAPGHLMAVAALAAHDPLHAA